MANPYFNFYQENSNEFNLYSNLTDEFIEMAGILTYYMPRNVQRVDMLLGEDYGAYFTKDTSFEISLYLENPLDFTNDEMYSKLGITIDNQANFFVQMQRIHQAIGNRPFTGDLIYIPMFNRVFEVSKAEEKSTFYLFGKLPTYKIVCSLLKKAGETFDTPYAELNSLNGATSISPSYSDNMTDNQVTSIIDFDETNPFNNF